MRRTRIKPPCRARKQSQNHIEFIISIQFAFFRPMKMGYMERFFVRKHNSLQKMLCGQTSCYFVARVISNW